MLRFSLSIGKGNNRSHRREDKSIIVNRYQLVSNVVHKLLCQKMTMNQIVVKNRSNHPLYQTLVNLTASLPKLMMEMKHLLRVMIPAMSLKNQTTIPMK